MVSSQYVEEQLKKIGCHYTLWGSTEVAELSTLLMEGEEIAVAINGYYEGGFGLLVATNYRVLIVDKKPFVLNVEDLRYEMITEVNYAARLLIAEMHIAIPTRTIYFNSWAMERLHQAMRYIQQHVMESREGSSTTPSGDWFKDKLAATDSHDHEQRRARMAMKLGVMISTMLHGSRQEDTVEKAPYVGYRSAMRGINPYRRTGGSLLRRRLPAFYS